MENQEVKEELKGLMGFFLCITFVASVLILEGLYGYSNQNPGTSAEIC